MDKETILRTIKEARGVKQRKFKQGIELIINLKDVDLKKPEYQVNQYLQLPHGRGKKIKICIFCGPELSQQAKANCDKAILLDEFDRYKKNEVKKIAEQHDYFIAQATVMTKMASNFGRILGPRGKMPDPKAGCVVPPNANLKPLCDKLQTTVKLKVKNGPQIQCAVGTEDMDDDKIAENILAAYESVVHHLPSEKDNIKNMSVKLTMGKPALVQEKQETVVKKKKK